MVAGHAVAGVTAAECPVMNALAGGTSGEVSNEDAVFAVECLGARNTNLVGILVGRIESWVAGASGSSVNRDWIGDSVASLRATGADILGASATFRAERGNWRWKLVVPKEPEYC